MPADQPREAHPAQKVWDAPTRLVHWGMAFCVAVSWWTVENKHMDWHYISGLTLVGLLVFRLWWGFAGPETARFARFVKGPRAVTGYLRKLAKPDYRAAFGHNPLGALSVVAMLLALMAQVTFGLFASDTDGLESGPLSRYVDYEVSEKAADLHADMFNILLVLIALHIAAIAFYLVVKRSNLVGPMLTGRRDAADNVEGPANGIRATPLWRLVLGAGLAVGVVWLVAH
jgi:cytochrome b